MSLILAPIQGMTIAHYRNLYAEYFGGIDTYYAPFIATRESSKISASLFKDLLPEFNNTNLNVIPQLIGNNSSDFRSFATTLVTMGYKEINWNIGCPYPMITKKKKGSGILPYPDMIKSFLDDICIDNNYALTVKMRLGLNLLDEGIAAIRILNDYPLNGVIIHGRVGTQKYEGTVNLDSFELLNDLSKHEVIYNGDIFTLADYTKIAARFPAINKFMLGRGALRDPFLPSAIKGNPVPTHLKISKMKAFHDAVYAHYKSILSGDRHLIDRMKEFWVYNSVHIDPVGKYTREIKKCHTHAAYEQIVSQMLDSSNTWKE
ncbi:MAG: tRNA-dihydrouridine synthase family protein [Vallitaleaceae bacterium]|jgi:tRNA-dihydrouridine synthase B|nr:tRNA-dihydrouridine synthase family protein [Vallitaleaceae bacterium]